MNINIKAFAISLTVIISTIILVISIWSRASSQFGHEFMQMYNSIHPHPFTIEQVSLSTAQEIYGAFLDFFYAAADSLIFSLGFATLYNKLNAKPSK